MTMKKNLVLAAALLMALAACGPGEEEEKETFLRVDPDGLITLDIGGVADLKDNMFGFRLEDYFDLALAILPDDDDERTFVKKPRFSYFDDNSILVCSYERVIRRSLVDGSFLGEYGRQGRGPGEYVQALGYFVLAGKTQLYDILDRDGTVLRPGPAVVENEGLLRSGGIRVGYVEMMAGLPFLYDGRTHYLSPVMADRGILVCRDIQDPEDESYFCFRLKNSAGHN